jgi:hypothetical protein
MWQSAWTLGLDHAASSNGSWGSGSSAGRSVAWNTTIGCAPASGRQARRPATCRHQASAACCIAASEPNWRPAKKLSRT